MNKNGIKLISSEDFEVVQRFLSNAGVSLQSFRYFDKRDFNVLKNHLVTAILYFNEEPIGYGHLDCEGAKTWLGIAIAEGYVSMGYGHQLLNFLIMQAKEANVKILNLSVDVDNTQAISIYKKIGFEVVAHLNKNIYLMEYKIV